MRLSNFCISQAREPTWEYFQGTQSLKTVLHIFLEGLIEPVFQEGKENLPKTQRDILYSKMENAQFFKR